MMKKNIKTGLVAFGMCLALPFCSLAAIKNPEKAKGREERAQIRTELSSYHETLDSNTKELTELINEKKGLIAEVKEAQKAYKTNGGENSAAAEFSENIKGLNVDLSDTRGKISDLRKSAKEKMQAGDADGAKVDLEESISIQENQIELQKSVIEQLNKKLELLKGAEA